MSALLYRSVTCRVMMAMSVICSMVNRGMAMRAVTKQSLRRSNYVLICLAVFHGIAKAVLFACFSAGSVEG